MQFSSPYAGFLIMNSKLGNGVSLQIEKDPKVPVVNVARATVLIDFIY